MSVFNPLDKFHKNIIGAINENQTIKFRVKGNFDSVILFLKKDCNGEMTILQMKNQEIIDGEKVFDAQFNLNVGLYYYYFEIDKVRVGCSSDFQAKFNCYDNFQLSVYSGEYVIPNTIKGGIIYQIFPDRFNKSKEIKQEIVGRVYHEKWNELPIFMPNENGKVLNNDFFGGDLKGIIEKIDYLKKLNVTAIYLNPIFKAYSNHRYDTGNYMEIDPTLGTLQDFELLIKECKKNGISVILDGVFNHTGSDSLYFNKYGNYNSVGAYQSKDSPYYSWYCFKDYPNDYESWWGIKTLPAINENDDNFVNYITGENGVIERYTKMGVDGWRLDVVDELPTNFVREIRNAVKRNNKDAIIIGEVWEDASNKIAYDTRREYFLGKELDSVMNYPLKNAILGFVKWGNTKELSNVIKMEIDHYPKIVLDNLMNILSTHDTFRLVSDLSKIDVCKMTKKEMSKIELTGCVFDDAVRLQKIASTLQFTLFGVPSIYYGDEISTQGFSDPLCRKTFDWNSHNKDIFEWYVKLGEIRSNYSVFESGEFEEIFCEDGVYAFKRFDENSEILVIANVSKSELNVNFDGELVDLLSNERYKNNLVVGFSSVKILVNLGNINI